MMKLPEFFLFDDKEVKPVAINHHIGRRPLIAGGNCDGDLQMLEYATMATAPALPSCPTTPMPTGMGLRPRFKDRVPRQGAGRGYDEGWIVVDITRDWRKVSPSQLQ